MAKDYQTITLPADTWSTLQVLLKERCRETMPPGWKRLVRTALTAMEWSPLHKRHKAPR